MSLVLRIYDLTKQTFLFLSNIIIVLSDGDLLDICLPKRGPMGKAYPCDILPLTIVMKEPWDDCAGRVLIQRIGQMWILRAVING